jgi:amino acid transporter
MPERELGRRGALFLSLGAVIGSGWLFAALDSAQFSGGSSVLAWLLAGLLACSLAVVYAELGSMFPVDGAAGRFPLYAFGRVAGFVGGWLSWIASICIAPIETVASLGYASHYYPWLTRAGGGAFKLTIPGTLVAAVVLLLFTLLNLFGVRVFRETNTAVVWFKLAIPVVIALILIHLHFRASNFSSHGGFFTGGVNGVLLAVSQGGVGFALLGFEQAVQLGGETKDPHRNIPWAVIGSVVVATALYLLLQMAFVGALSPLNLLHGWSGLDFGSRYGPYAGLLAGLGVAWAVYLIYLTASISPAGTGLTYTTTASRVPFALAREGYLPSQFGRLNGRKAPVVSLLVCYCVELVLLVSIPEWKQLLAFATASIALVYGLAPLSLATLRRTAPDYERPYRLAHHQVLARLAFVVANLILYWCGWNTDKRLLVVVLAGVLIQMALATVRQRYRYTRHEWQATVWLAPYLVGMGILSAIGRYGGGGSALPFGVDQVIIVLFSLGIFEWAVRRGVAVHQQMPAGGRPIDRWIRTARLSGIDHRDAAASVSRHRLHQPSNSVPDREIDPGHPPG